MSGYMLDSNVLIDIARDAAGIVAKRFEAKALGETGISVVVAGEIQFGMRKRSDARSNPTMAYLLGSLRIDALDQSVAGFYANIRAESERSGLSVSPNDYWIAAHAIANDAVLVTGDRALYESRIAGLKLEDWRVE